MPRIGHPALVSKEVIQDNIGNILVDTSSINFTYDDANNQIMADVLVDNSSIEIDASNGLQLKADGIKDTHIDWGAGANQVSAVDLPIADAGSIITGTEVETALQENRTAIDLNTTHRGLTNNPHSVTLAQVGGASAALDNLASVAINASLVPASDSAIDLGSSAPKYFANAYVDKIYLEANNTIEFTTDHMSINKLGDGGVYLFESADAGSMPNKEFRIYGWDSDDDTRLEYTKMYLDTLGNLYIDSTTGGGGSIFFVSDIRPSTTSSRDLGSSGLYWAEGYIDKIYLNATASLDGSIAGLTNVTGGIKLTSTLADAYAWENGGAGLYMTVNSSYDKYQAALRGAISNTADNRSSAIIGLDFAVNHWTANALANAFGVLTTFQTFENSAVFTNAQALAGQIVFSDKSGQEFDNYYLCKFQGIDASEIGENTATITNFYGFYLPDLTTDNVTITNRYGVYIADTAALNYFGGVVNTAASYQVDGTQVVSNRVIDARCDDALNSGDATTDGVIDALRDAMITHGLIAAS